MGERACGGVWAVLVKNWCQLVRLLLQCCAETLAGQCSAVLALMHGKHKGCWRFKDAFSPPELALRHHPALRLVNTHRAFRRRFDRFACLRNTDARNKCSFKLPHLKAAAARRASPREAPMPVSHQQTPTRFHGQPATAGWVIDHHLHQQSAGAVLLSLWNQVASSPQGVSAGAGPGSGTSPRHHASTATVPQVPEAAAPEQPAHLSSLTDLR